MTESLPEQAQKDSATVTAAGEPVGTSIVGVVLRPAVTHVDARGELTEIYNPAWGVHPIPLLYAYQSMVRPGRVKGWVLHRRQDDRVFVSLGTLKWVLFDAREDSPTKGLLQEIFLAERKRGLLIIPAGVIHAVQNVGLIDAVFINLPTRPYDHADPDKYRLPLDTPDIPYSFG